MLNQKLLEQLCEEAGEKRTEKAKEYVKNRRVNITKVFYDDSNNFEVYGRVNGNYDIYATKIQVVNGEMENVSCTCPDYEKHYGSCKHIVATMQELLSNKEYIRIFAGIQEKETSYLTETQKRKLTENSRIFKQLIQTFYGEDSEEEIKQEVSANTIHIEPKIIYNSYNKTIKLEIKIGEKQLYKIKKFSEFYENMLQHEYYTYGQKLAFTHTKEAFTKEDLPMLEYILKYSEIIKYANESSSEYGYYGRTLSDNYITISNTGIDELFEVLKEKSVNFQKDGYDGKIIFLPNEPHIEFKLKEKNKKYYLEPNIDIYNYDIIFGKEYIYILMENILYRCSKEFQETTLKLLEVFRKNFITQMEIQEEDLPKLFSIVFPKVKKIMEIEGLEQEKIEKYIPKELAVKVYLDYDANNYITADLQFIYSDKSFNPISEEPEQLARDYLKENEIVEMFRKDKFLLDSAHNRLILVNEDAIYHFLSERIEEYMEKFEVLATENFKQKEIKQPHIGTLGVKIENDLLKIDFSQIEFDINELQEIMEKYKLKKKFFRLKDGSYLNLEENNTMNFIQNITEGIEIEYNKIKDGELSIPAYRTMYLEKALKNLEGANIQKNSEYKKMVEKIEEKNVNTEIELPKGLNATLRNYQKVGYQWLKVLDEYQFGGILADDMGLGKTLQLLSVVQSYVEKEENPKPSIVVCPSSLTLNWKNEAEKFTKDLNVIAIQGSSEQRKNRIESIPKYQLVITSYDLLKRDIELYKEADYTFKYIIADEAQYIKNNNTQNAKAIKEIKAKTKYALTGTPIENSLSELWSIFDFIMPGYLFGYRKFKELYEMPIVKDNDKKAMNKLKMLIEPFILRRIKTEVLTELPDKTITVLNNEMQDEQEKIYMSFMQSAKQEAENEIKMNGFERSQIRILALLMRLRQICCHPSLFIDNYKGESSKLNQCMEVIKDGVSAGHKILLFSGYTAMFPIIEKELKKENIEYFKLTGQTKVAERINLVEEFNKNENIKIFLISLKAGGTGLNLTGADMVIHYDPWWNLSAENQATDRTYRIGQKRNVQVYKLITKNSIEERIYELQQKKAALIDNMLSTNETFLNKLSKEEIMDLFK